MIITFYDRDFNALQDNASLNVGEWSLIRRAVDFDDFTATSEPFLEKINPTFVVLKDDYGRYKYGAFAGIPELTKENKTKLQASDLKTLFNNEILAQFLNFTSVVTYLSDVIQKFKNQVIQNSFEVEFDTTNIHTDILITDLVPEDTLRVYNVWEECILPYLKYYDLFIETKLDVKNKKIIFYLKRTNNRTLPLRLWEYNITNYGKYIVSINETIGAVNYDGNITYGIKWILLSDNSITSTEANRDLFPIKKKIILEETEDSTEVTALLNKVNAEALKQLVEARYQESFQISIDNDSRFTDIDFDVQFIIYSERGIFYKNLPLGEIQENQRGTKTIKIGYKPDDIVYYL